MSSRYGYWDWDRDRLPVYAYTGGYPCAANNKIGEDARLPEDPCFILGNYRATLFVHASGMFQFVTGERGWARLNYGGKNKGWNQSTVRLAAGRQPLDEEAAAYPLVGELTLGQRVTRQRFGAGYASYTYELPEGLLVHKVIAMQPSEELHAGNPSFIIEVTLSNPSDNPLSVTYTEELLAKYMMMNDQSTAAADRMVDYRNELAAYPEQQLVKANIGCTPLKLMVFPESTAASYTHDIAPPSLYMKGLSADVGAAACQVAFRTEEIGDILSASYDRVLEAGAQTTIRTVIGLTFLEAADSVEEQTRAHDSERGAHGAEDSGLYSKQWRRVLPNLEDEEDEILRREMLWNAYTLEAMATYSQYFHETYVPQGSVYAYHLGENASNRDHLQHSLPLIYTNPKLAKSSIRYAMKHSSQDGEIKRQNIGFGYSNPSVYMESDPQLYMYMAVSEYLRVTEDYDFLSETIHYYPAEAGQTEKVLTLLVKHFIYLRDTVGRGKHGLVRMLNSDWSDSFFHPYSPNIYTLFAESHMNTAMALAVIPSLMKQLVQGRELLGNDKVLLDELVNSLSQYYEEVHSAYMADLEGRTFSPRCYLGEHDEPHLKFGMETMCIEAQPYLLQIESFPVERKLQLYEEIKSRVLGMEKHGARTREVPLWSSGEGEDGGIWFAHQGPLIAGIASFDQEEARKLLKKLTFHRFAENYPDYWLGAWTATDYLNSTLSNREGLYSGWLEEPFQPYCAHVHAWMLYSYYRLYRDLNVD
ncbi:GH36-type glycosyl hydrolase domain-containing protein [Paenibacillus sp. GCM10023252]|uniref:GH36-type glycosyl hydrolase domain-containing protein n=1 Tax=Paenibacillus sp. GCM10023252 TaxID=3252649 RepID=UPI003612D01B